MFVNFNRKYSPEIFNAYFPFVSGNKIKPKLTGKWIVKKYSNHVPICI